MTVGVDGATPTQCQLAKDLMELVFFEYDPTRDAFLWGGEWQLWLKEIGLLPPRSLEELTALLHPNSARELARALASRSVFSLRIGLPKNDREWRWFLLRGRFEGGRMQVVSQEISKQVASEEELYLAKQAVEEATKTRSTFVATVSHELRTPLTGILGMSELLLDSELSREQRQWASTVREAAQAQLELVNELLDFARSEAGVLELFEEPFNLLQPLEQTLELIGKRAHDKQLELTLVVSPEVPIELHGDAVRLRQVLLNIVSNAVKFTAIGHVRIDVSVEQETPEYCFLRFAVQDTGPGISREEQSRLFAPFVQLEEGRQRRFAGTGLGLAICRRVVDAMGGRITVESTPGNGSIFAFVLPFGFRSKQQRYGNPPEHGRSTTAVVFSSPLVYDALRSRLDRFGVASFATQDPEAFVSAFESLSSSECILALVDPTNRTPSSIIRALEQVRDKGINVRPVVLLPPGTSVPGWTSSIENATIVRKPIVDRALLPLLRPIENGAAQKKKSEREHKKKVLVVDDTPIAQRLAQSALEKLGYHATVSSHGKEALEQLSRESFALVLMDCHMPELDGFLACEELRRREQGQPQRTPVVAMTASALPEDRSRCFDAGMDDCLVKPFRLAELAEVLERWIPN